MLNLTNHQGNTDQKHTEILPHTSEDGCHREEKREQELVKVCRKGNPRALWWECNLVQPLGKTVQRLLKKLKLYLPFNPAILLLGMYPTEVKIGEQSTLCTPVFIRIIHNSQEMGRNLRPVDGGMQKKDAMYTE